MPEYRYRDAGTGRYVTEEYALAHPDTTVAEEVGVGVDVPIEELVGYPYFDPIPLDSGVNLYRAWLDYQISNDALNTNPIWIATQEDGDALDYALGFATAEVVNAGRQPRLN